MELGHIIFQSSQGVLSSRECQRKAHQYIIQQKCKQATKYQMFHSNIGFQELLQGLCTILYLLLVYDVHCHMLHHQNQLSLLQCCKVSARIFNFRVSPCYFALKMEKIDLHHYFHQAFHFQKCHAFVKLTKND
jgi:hypothetical protein